MNIGTVIARLGGGAAATAAGPDPDPQDTAGFDAAWYLRAYPDVAAAGMDPRAHYLQSGWREGRSPSADFDGVFYRMTVSAPLAPDLCPLVHYNRAGKAANAPRSRAEALEGTPFRPDAALVTAAHPGLADLFDADHYLSRYPDAGPSDPLAHYLTHGWQEGRNPSAGFDTAFYRERFMSGDAADICPLLHYHLYGRAAALPPTRREAMERSRALAAGQDDPAPERLSTLPDEVKAVLLAPFFSRSHYLAAYPDVARSGSDPYRHYIAIGWREGRVPGPLFDPSVYVAPADADLPPLLHYAVIGRMTGRSGSRHEVHLAQERAAEALADERLAGLLQRLGYPADLIDRWRIREVILPMFSAEECRRRHGLGPAVSDVEAFLRYLALDLPAGIPPGPLFSADHYLTEVARLVLPPLRPQDHAFHHWLRHGHAAGASPTPAFVAADYLALNADLAGYPGPLWGHLILHGASEGRRFSLMASVAPGRQAVFPPDEPPRSVRFLERLSRRPSPDFRAMQDFHRSGRLEQTIAEAALHEPEIGELGPPGRINAMIPAWHDEGWAAYEQVLDLLPPGPVDAVVLMPFGKLGGADFVAGVLAATLAEAGRKVLVLRTDAPDWARPDWFPPDCPSLDLSQHLAKAHQPQRMLYELLVRLRPADVYNVNSRLAFQTFERFGERLALMMRLNAYYFCTDRTPEGAETGYPVSDFSNILGHLTAAMIDNAALAGQLAGRFGLSGEWRGKVRVIYTPAMTPPPAVPVAVRQVETAPQRLRRRILWAGRLDAQKRFDLVQEIARLLPEVDFDCWGKAVLDAPPDLSRLPANLRMHGAFAGYDDLPLAASDGWLYTSGWDGIPTILIELAAHGLPIVASAVGGVPELIDETTGWPLAAGATANDYAAAIREMLDAPVERCRRAAALQDRVRRQHSRAAYAAALADAAKGG